MYPHPQHIREIPWNGDDLKMKIYDNLANFSILFNYEQVEAVNRYGKW